MAHYGQALRINPDHAETHYNLGLALARLGKEREAIPHWEQAVRLKPDFAEAHSNLGLALAHVGRVREAIDHQETAAQLMPDSARAVNNLARLLATTAPAAGGGPGSSHWLGAAGLRTYRQSGGDVRRHPSHRLRRGRPIRRGGRHRAESGGVGAHGRGSAVGRGDRDAIGTVSQWTRLPSI